MNCPIFLRSEITYIIFYSHHSRSVESFVRIYRILHIYKLQKLFQLYAAGVNKAHTLYHVTMPLLRKRISVTTILRIIIANPHSAFRLILSFITHSENKASLRLFSVNCIAYYKKETHSSKWKSQQSVRNVVSIHIYIHASSYIFTIVHDSDNIGRYRTVIFFSSLGKIRDVCLTETCKSVKVFRLKTTVTLRSYVICFDLSFTYL
jgi:hypothetical protein